MSNVLLLSAGRRVDLTNALKDAIDFYKPTSKLYCADMRPQLSAACQVAENSYSLPHAQSSEYTNALLQLCLDKNISLVVPTIDTELLVLSRLRERFKEYSIDILISDEEFIASCRDKRKTADLFDDLNIDQPKIYSVDNLVYPCFCKPYDGSSSIGTYTINNPSELTEDLACDPKNMFMELIPSSFCEYTIDLYFTDQGVLRCIVPRKRIEIRGGEVSKGVTRRNFVYDYLIKKLQFLKGARGCITLQLFVNEKTQEIKGLEVNPRFGGGYPLAHDAGAKFTHWLIGEYMCSKHVEFFDDWESDLLMLRFDSKVLKREYS